MAEAGEDPTDIFDTSLGSLFSIPPIAFSPSPGSYHVYTPPASSSAIHSHRKPIELSLPQPPSNLYTTLQANNLWLSGIYLADLIATDVISGNVEGKHVAELGAGAGLPGIVACRDGPAATVVSSDWGVEEVLSVLRDNFARACGRGDGTNKWHVVGHEWGTDTSRLLSHLDPGDLFDTLLLADVIWVTEAHRALLDSIGGLLKSPGGIAHVTAGLHTGRGPIARFIAKAVERGWKVELKGEVRWKLDGGWEKYDESMIRGGNEEERGVVVWFTLHV